jgi:hypothetical protein
MRFLLVTFILLAACAPASDQAIRHTVVAELIERLDVPESNIEIRQILHPDAGSATARVVVQGLGARGGFEYYQATLSRTGQRWQFRALQREP